MFPCRACNSPLIPGSLSGGGGGFLCAIGGGVVYSVCVWSSMNQTFPCGPETSVSSSFSVVYHKNQRRTGSMDLIFNASIDSNSGKGRSSFFIPPTKLWLARSNILRSGPGLRLLKVLVSSGLCVACSIPLIMWMRDLTWNLLHLQNSDVILKNSLKSLNSGFNVPVCMWRCVTFLFQWYQSLMGNVVDDIIIFYSSSDWTQIVSCGQDPIRGFVHVSGKKSRSAWCHTGSSRSVRILNNFIVSERLTK